MSGRQAGFTRASALGPIADFLDRQGGSITRVMNDVDLPLAILDNPDTPVPLKEQFRLLERAARDTGDPYFGARLGQNVRIKELSAFGKWVSEAETTAGAIDRSNRGLNLFLQTGTVLKLEEDGSRARWSIEFLDPGLEGRYHNELLGLSYLIDVVRCFAGRTWTPDVVCTTADRNGESGSLDLLFNADTMSGHHVPTIEFDANVLAFGRFDAAAELVGGSGRLDAEPAVPPADDDHGAILAVTSLALLESYPRIDWVASKLGMTRRSLQRRLSERGTTFSRLLDDMLRDRARTLLAVPCVPITDIAMRLGYTDTAHFSRAFRRWTGMSPSSYRNRLAEAGEGLRSDGG